MQTLAGHPPPAAESGFFHLRAEDGFFRRAPAEPPAAYLFVVLGWTKAAGLEIGDLPNRQALLQCVTARPAMKAAPHAEGLRA